MVAAPVMISTGNGTASLSIESAGAPHRIYSSPEGDYYIIAVPGITYSLAVRNLTSRRIEVISSVDGRNTLKDEAAHSHSSTGLVIPAYGEYRFAGWRVDDDTVREFIFGDDVGDSVVAQAGGDISNKGVIGIAAWREKTPVRVRPRGSVLRAGGSGPVGQSVSTGATMDSYTERPAPKSWPMPPAVMASAGGTEANAPAMDWNDLSTGIGKAQHDHVGRTSLTRGSGPDLAVIRYATYNALLAAGVVSTAQPASPVAFLGNPGSTGYGRYDEPKSRR